LKPADAIIGKNREIKGVRRGRLFRKYFLLILALVCGALACTNPSNKNPPQTSGSAGTGIVITGTAGSIVPPPPDGNVIVEIQQPTADLVALAGSLVDVVTSIRVDQGTDVIDPTSVEAKVTAMGDTAEVDSTKLTLQGADAFVGRMSLGDRPTGFYTLTVTAVSSSGVASRPCS